MTETAAVSWAAAELGGANLGDARLNRRLVRVAERLGAPPGARIPVACGRDARGWFEHWTVRLGAVWLCWEVRGPSALVGGERCTPLRVARSVRV